ncbi:MAG: TolC family protein [Mariprofundaceae bacterium]|nr:TolC family protein [Mariprofundaceae bacterium]
MFFLFSILKNRYILMLLVAFPTLAHSASTLGLQESVQQMLQHNLQLKSAAEGVESMRSQVKVAQSYAMPNINLSTGWRYSNDPLEVFGNKLSQQSVSVADFVPSSLNAPAYRQNYQTRLGLSLPLFSGGALQAAASQAEAQAESSALMFAFQKQQRIYQTIAIYLQARQARDQQIVQQKSVDVAIKRWKDVEALQMKGMALASDVMHAHVYVLQRQQMLAKVNNDVENSQEKLSLIMGGHQDLHGVTLGRPRIQSDIKPLPVLLEKAVDMRLDFKAMQQQMSMLEARQDELKSLDLPKVNLVAAQTWNSVTPNIQHGNSSVGITISMNVWDGGGADAQQRRATWKKSELAWKLQDKQQQMQHEIKQAYRALHLAKQHIQRQQEAVKQTQEALRIQSLRYQQGLETTSNLLRAQLASDEAEVSTIQSTYDVILAKAALLLAAGLLNEGVVQ